VSAAIALTVSGSRAQPATEPYRRAPVAQVSTTVVHTPSPQRAETAGEHIIRIRFADALSNRPGLDDRPIAISIDGGDVTLTGTVQSEAEREQTNEIAINIPGVRSVANALRIAPSGL